MSFNMMDQVRGHLKVKDQIRTFIEKSRVPSTMIFTGPAGVGKKMMALAFAQAMICQKQTLACGECDACLRVFKKQSENLLFIEPESTMIKMSQSKSVLNFFSMANIGGARIVVIDQADTLNVQAANALLKILEEPPANSHIILVTSSIAGLLPTIRSRSQIVRFSGLAKDDLAKIMYAPAWALAAAQGRADILQQVASEEFQSVRTRSLDLLFQFLKGHIDFELREQLLELFKDKETAFQVLRVWQQGLRDLRVIYSQNAELIHRDHLSDYQELSQLSENSIDNFYRHIVRLEGEFKANMDRTLAVEDFYYKFKSERL